MGTQSGSGIRLLDALPEDGERKLMLAVLMDAIRILRQTPHSQLGLSRSWVEERRWIESDEHRKPFAFVAICNALGIQPEYVRRCVLGTNPAPLPMNGRRYSAKAEETWNRLRRPRTLGATRTSRTCDVAKATAAGGEVVEEGDSYTIATAVNFACS